MEGKTLYEYDNLSIYKEFLNLLSDNLKIQFKGEEKHIENFYKIKTQKRMSNFLSKYDNTYFTSEYNINSKK